MLNRMERLEDVDIEENSKTENAPKKRMVIEEDAAVEHFVCFVSFQTTLLTDTANLPISRHTPISSSGPPPVALGETNAGNSCRATFPLQTFVH